MTNDEIKQLFVAYSFLGIDTAETETPFSLPKPMPYHQIQFNFNKSMYVIINKTKYIKSWNQHNITVHTPSSRSYLFYQVIVLQKIATKCLKIG